MQVATMLRHQMSLWCCVLLLRLQQVAAADVAHDVPAGIPRHFAELPLNGEMSGCRSCGRPFVVRRLSERPAAFLLQNFLSAEECDTLMGSAELAGFEAAETTGKTQARHRCDVALLSPSRESVLAAVQSDAARALLSSEALQTPGGGVEELNVLRYQPGGEYTLHYDAMNNPRVLTILYYLNGVGATWFPLADNPTGAAVALADSSGVVARATALDPAKDGLRVTPTSAGDALVFYNFDGRGEPDSWALHAGLEVAPSDGEKWLGTHFFNHPRLCAGYEGYVL